MGQTPKYLRVRHQVEEMIAGWDLSSTKPLPSEPELARRFSVSRSVIRQAFDELARQGMISRHPGSGTYVVRKMAKKEGIVSLAEQIRAAGMVPSTRVSGHGVIKASQAEGRVCEAFNLEGEGAETTEVYFVDRLRYGDDKCLARQVIYLSLAQFPYEVLAQEDFTKSIFGLYERYGHYPSWADEVIEARLPTRDEIRLLQINPSDRRSKRPWVYERQRITYDQTNTVLEVLFAVDRSDFFRCYRYRILEGRRFEMEAGCNGSGMRKG